MKIVHIIGTVNPSYGGPVAVLQQLVIVSNKLGHQSEIVTLDEKGSCGIDQFQSTVYAMGPSRGKYRYNSKLLPWLSENSTQYDAVIVHGIWQYQSFATWLAWRKIGFPYFVFTHGALDSWFRRAYPIKHIKKWLYWPWAEYHVLKDAKAVLFTNQEEADLAPKSFWLYKANGVVANVGIEEPSGNAILQKELFIKKFPHLQKRQIVLFLSRLHRKKGCDMLINGFAAIATLEIDLHLVIAGPDQDGEMYLLKKRVAELGISQQVTFTGMLEGDLKWGAFRAADVFILPSHSENFGVAVAEALACSLPVLISNKINIWREIYECNAGFVEEDTTEGVILLLKHWLVLSLTEKQEMRKNAKQCFLNYFNMETNAEKYIAMLQEQIKKWK